MKHINSFWKRIGGTNDLVPDKAINWNNLINNLETEGKHWSQHLFNLHKYKDSLIQKKKTLFHPFRPNHQLTSPIYLIIPRTSSITGNTWKQKHFKLLITLWHT